MYHSLKSTEEMETEVTNRLYRRESGIALLAGTVILLAAGVLLAYGIARYCGYEGGLGDFFGPSAPMEGPPAPGQQ